MKYLSLIVLLALAVLALSFSAGFVSGAFGGASDIEVMTQEADYWARFNSCYAWCEGSSKTQCQTVCLQQMEGY